METDTIIETVSCPRCYAPKGERCESDTGRYLLGIHRNVVVHGARRLAADRYLDENGE